MNLLRILGNWGPEFAIIGMIWTPIRGRCPLLSAILPTVLDEFLQVFAVKMAVECHGKAERRSDAEGGGGQEVGEKPLDRMARGAVEGLAVAKGPARAPSCFHAGNGCKARRSGRGGPSVGMFGPQHGADRLQIRVMAGRGLGAARLGLAGTGLTCHRGGGGGRHRRGNGDRGAGLGPWGKKATGDPGLGGDAFQEQGSDGLGARQNCRIGTGGPDLARDSLFKRSGQTREPAEPSVGCGTCKQQAGRGEGLGGELGRLATIDPDLRAGLIARTGHLRAAAGVRAAALAGSAFEHEETPYRTGRSCSQKSAK